MARYPGILVLTLACAVAQAQPGEDEVALLRNLDVANVHRDTRILSESIVNNRSGAGPGSAQAGSEAERQLAEWMARRFEALGLEVERQRFPVRAFEYGEVSLQAVGQRFPAITFHSGGGTWGRLDGRDYRNGNAAGGKVIEAPLANLGDGLAADYDRAGEVRGRVVLVRWTMWPGFLIREASARGAAAIILHDYPGRSEPDALKQNTVIGRDAIPAVHVSEISAERLQALLERGDVTVRLENRVDSAIGESYNVIGTLTGREHPGEWLLVGAHHDRWFHGAQDNAIGGAVMLELGRVLTLDGPPRRSLALVSFGAEETGGIGTEYDWLTGSHAFVRAYPGRVGSVVYGFNVDGAGWTAERGNLHASLELHGFQEQVLSDLGLASRVELRNGVTTVVDAWTLGVNGAASMAYLLWFDGHAIDSGEPNPYSSYYHTQHDRFRVEWYANLEHDLRLAALSLSRMDRLEALPLKLSAVGSWVDAELARLGGLLESAGPEFSAAREAAARFTGAALAAEQSSGERNAELLQARRLLVPWLYSQSTRGAVLRPEPYLDDLRALDAALAGIRGGDPGRAADALIGVGTMGWGAVLSEPAYRAERLAAHSRPDWSQEYGQTPTAVGADVHAVYQALRAGRDIPAQEQRLAAMRTATAEHLRGSLFVLEGRLSEATRALTP